MARKRFGLWFLFAVVAFVLVLYLTAYAQTFNTTGNPGDTEAGTNISVPSSECTLDYTDTVGNPQAQINADSDINIAVAAEYGFSGIGTPVDQGTRANDPVYYTYVVTNEGNTSDTYDLTIEDITYGNGASGWTIEIVSAETDDVISSLLLAEDADGSFRVKVTPDSGAQDTEYAQVTVQVATTSTPIGEYTGGNGLTYGGTSEVQDITQTDVSGPTLTLTRTSTVDAPSSYTGGIHDAVPGAVITFTYDYSNNGGASAEGNVIVDKIVDTYTEGSHVNATAVPNVTITAPQSTATGWIVSTSEVTTPSGDFRNYGSTEGWTVIGTINGNGDYATTSGGNGNFSAGISPNTTYIKFEKLYIDPSEDNETLTWGVTIK